MSKAPYKNTKLLIFTIAVLFGAALCARALMKHTGIGEGFNSFRSGIFINMSQEIHNEGWTFSAEEANGYNVIFTDLNRGALDNLYLRSHIGGGEMSLIIECKGASKIIDLSAEETAIPAGSLDMSGFEPGRVEMRLIFTGAVNVFISLSWEQLA